MAKRKQSTFERLRNGKLQWNRKERREVERRLNSADPGLEIIHPHAAGIDVGNESHHVAVPAGRDARPVREFGSWTAALEEMAQWLKSCGIKTVVMESTGVYWIAAFELLESRGFEVKLVQPGHQECPGPQDRRVGLPMDSTTAHLWVAGRLRSAPEKDVAVAKLPAATRSVRRDAARYPAYAEGPHRDERAVAPCHQRSQRGDRAGHYSRPAERPTRPAKISPKFQNVWDSILLIRREIIQNSVSSYWQQVQQLISLGLQLAGRRHLLKGRTGRVPFQAVGHARLAG